MLVPVYRGDERPAWKVRAGLLLYDLLSFRKSLPRSRAMPARALNSYEPGLNRDGLRGAYVMYDAQVEFPERLVIESVREFTDAGGVALNHVAATGSFRRAACCGASCCGTPARAKPRAEREGRRQRRRARGRTTCCAAATRERHDRLIGGTKGSHLVVEWPGGPRTRIFAAAKEDGRPFFILPWYRYTLVGTTDIRYDGDPSRRGATPEAEVRYLLDEANAAVPARHR